MSMNDFKIPVEVDPNEDTEWNDILRDKGIIPEKPPSPSAQLEEALEEAVAKQHQNRLENKDLDELDALEDEEDEEFLQFYKAQRVQQLQALTARQKFGSVQYITKPEYEKEITLSSVDDTFVILHMSSQSVLQSRLLSNHFNILAATFPELKFTDIPANRCVENYPESNCPTILIYHNKDVVKQYVTLTQLGGNDTKLKDIEKMLVGVNAVDVNDGRLTFNQMDEDLAEERKLRFVKKSLRSGGARRFDSDDDDHDDDDDDFYD